MLWLRTTGKYGSDTNCNDPGFCFQKSESLYPGDNPWIGSYHVQNSSQHSITSIPELKFNKIIITTLNDVHIRVWYEPQRPNNDKQRFNTAELGVGAFNFFSNRQTCASVHGHQSYHPSWLNSCSSSDPAYSRTIPKNGIGPRHQPYDALKWLTLRVKMQSRKGYRFPMHKQQNHR